MSSKLVPTRNLNLFPLHLVSTILVYTGQVTAVPNLPASALTRAGGAIGHMYDRAVIHMTDRDVRA